MSTESGGEASNQSGPARPAQVLIENLRIGFEAVPESALMFDPDGKILEANPAALAQFEADTPDQLLGKNVYSLGVVEPKQGEEAVAAILRGEPSRFEMDFRTLKGNRRRLEILVIPFLTATGEVDRVLGFGRDITAQRRSERERDLLAEIVGSSEDAIISVSTDFLITTWNRGAEKLLGFTAAEAIGQPFTIYISPERHAYARQVVEQLEEHPDQVFRFEGICQTKDGRKVVTSNVCFAIRGAKSEMVGLAAIHRDLSEQKRAEREQALLAAIVESSDDAIFSHSPDLRITSWNRGAERLFGFTAEEAIGRLTLDLIVPTDVRDSAKAQMEQDFAAVRENRTVVRRSEVRVQQKDSAILDVSMVASGLHDSSGQMLGMSMIMRDISEQKRAERDRSLLAAIVNASEDGIIGCSLDSTVTSWNLGAEKIFGLSSRDALGRVMFEFLAPEERDRIRAVEAQVRESRRPTSFKVHALRQDDGAPFDVWVMMFPTYDSAGNLTGIAGIGRDITALLKLEGERALLASIVEASQDAIISVSKDEKITSWNAGAERLYGYSAEEALKRNFDFFIPAEAADFAHRLHAQALTSGRPLIYEQRGRKRDGTSFDVSISVFPTYDSSGNVIGTGGIARDITRQKEIERELREAQEYTRGLIESSIDAIVVVDPKLTITDANEQLAKLTELPKKGLIGSRFDSYFTDSARAADAVHKTLAEGYVINYELVLLSAAGKEVQVSFNASLFYRAGMVYGILGVARDVTEQRAMQRKLIEEQQYSRGLIECSPEALLVSDSNLVLTDMNQSAARVTGYSREELLGASLASLFSDPGQARALVKRSFDEGFVANVELDLLTKSAQPVPVALNASVYTDAHGSVRGALIGFHDISEHKSYEKQRSLLASIVDSSGDAIFSETPDLTITSWNASAERLFGYKASEIIGRNASLLVPLDSRTEFAEHVHRLAQTGKSEHFETRRIRKDGTAVDVAITESPIFDSFQKLAGISVTTHDISDRKRLDQELTKARDVAVEAARVKSEFLANMSHEIRTPLNSIIGLAGLLLDTELTPQQREFANDVRDSSEVLLTLISEILDFSKMVAGGISFEEADFELSDVVDEAAQLVAEQARAKGLQLTTSIDDDVPRFLRGDAARLLQVLLNLIGNAVKFTDRGEVAIQVNKLSETPKDSILRFEVRDTGIGIPEDKLHLLFRPFSQVDGSMTRHFGGTGLGLSIAREIVERMGGTITVTSKPGAGSTFWFTARFGKQIDVARPASEHFAMLTGARVLIVDDNAASRQILSQQALSWGMEPAIANSALEALQMMQSATATRPFLVALVDVMMPDMDGIELARKIEADPKLAATAVIFISSVGPKIDFIARLQGLDVKGWLTKPVPRSLLYNALAKVLSHPQAPEAERHPASKNGRPSPSQLPKPPQTRKFKALIAEDNPINQKLAVLQLKKLGLEVDTAANGREAVEAVMRTLYDVVLMDCQMPGMDGYEATREIRRRQGVTRHTKIVAMTAHAMAGDREKCLDAGMDDYVSKPVKLEALQAALARVITPEPSSELPDEPAPALDNPPPLELPAAPPHDSPANPVAQPQTIPTDSADQAAATPPLDAQVVADLRAEGGSLLPDLIGLFLDEAPASIRAIGEAFAANDLEAVALSAHRLKGSAMTFGAQRMSELCRELEAASRARDLAKAQILFNQLKPECSRVADALKSERQLS